MKQANDVLNSCGIQVSISPIVEYPENSECLKQIKSLRLGRPMSEGCADDDQTITTIYWGYWESA
jgi:hypothetical protein